MRIAIDIVNGKIINIFSDTKDVEVAICYGTGVLSDEEQDALDEIVSCVPFTIQPTREFHAE